ncbi:MAG: MoaD/ThiS family protein [Candidatus Thorarchaeota archaeon]|jgi:molybdopterin converting factor small subunit
MKVNVKLYATLQKLAPPDTRIGEAFTVELDGSTILELVEQLGIEEEQARIVMINGVRVDDMSQELKADDLVVIFPPIGGG